MTTQTGAISSTIRQNVRQIELFSNLSDDEIDILVKHSKIRSLVEDEALFRQGDDGDFFVIIIDGRIEITKHTEKETPVALASLTRGDTLGEMALIDQEKRSASAIAIEPTSVFILSRKSFNLLVDQYPRCGTKLLRKLATILCSHLRETSRLFAESIEPNLLT
ncbi:cyclic nucleotide-binding domain-containing protein [Desulfopila sp. IMCC35008]|uniref:cyclic nucleotide-binding domain-containing protein n=1 Tax=Desulfopila sp. IMCC35008 TaxID=2653858 RepID=UPI0013D6C57A|nr:cyclic nucleotide-binding domain-containing protein [Desulfopila sp. IMCC35008]